MLTLIIAINFHSYLVRLGPSPNKITGILWSNVLHVILTASLYINLITAIVDGHNILATKSVEQRVIFRLALMCWNQLQTTISLNKYALYSS